MDEGTRTGVRLRRHEDVGDTLGKERICRLWGGWRKTELGEELGAQYVGKEVHSSEALVGEGRECFVGLESTN